VQCSANSSYENKFTDFDISAKHIAVNSKKYVVMLSIVIKEFESKFQDR